MIYRCHTEERSERTFLQTNTTDRIASAASNEAVKRPSEFNF